MGCCLSRSEPKKEEKENKKSSKSKQRSQTKEPSLKLSAQPSIEGSIALNSKTEKKLMQNFKILKTYKKRPNGSIYLAKEKTTNKFKIIKEYHKSNSEESKKVFDEILTLQELDHPNIVKIFEVVNTKNKIYVIREYCPGGELFDKIIQSQQISENQAAKYMHDILDVVKYCHSKGVIHRDLNPAHLLLDSKNDDANLKVANFGLSGTFTEDTKLKRSVGDTCYMAPEIFEGEYSKEVDVWSCGVILCTLILGRPPFHGKTREKIIKSINDGLNLSTGIWLQVSDDLKDLISKMLEKNPKKRISAKDALSHSWIESRSSNSVPDKAISGEALSRLSKFTVRSKIEQSILNFISYQTTSSREEKELIQLFKSIDINGDGKLSSDEVQKALKKLQVGSKEEISSIMKSCDKDGSGFIEYSEFVTGVSRWNKKFQENQLRDIFKMYDTDGDGLLSIGELEGCIPGIEGSEWENFFRQADANQDGLISVDELKAYFQAKFSN
ncbi:CDPK1_36 [Blepharisma stoltei]|uniref:Calcium-dependent protein kinase n=1 Tax=Blepharisma stoltei TaxID=1481888 RepID=A0AAU9J7F8_9CILI|nr:unnamed protein product [Blepharisma stoltei]